MRFGDSITDIHGLVADANENTRAAFVFDCTYISSTVDSGWPSRA